MAKKANAELKPFVFENREQQSMEIIDEIVEAYKARRGNVPMNLFPEHGNDDTLTGVSEGSLKKFLGDSWKPLIDLLVSGDIKGIAGVVGCSNLTAGGHDVLSVELTKELIAKDILVLTAGCSSGGIENCGLMEPKAAELAGPKLRAVCEKLGIPPVLNFGPCLAIGRLEIVATELAKEVGVDLPQLPLVLSAAQWLEEQALADGCFGLALGLPLHLGTSAFRYRKRPGGEASHRRYEAAYRRTGDHQRRRERERGYSGEDHYGKTCRTEYLTGGRDHEKNYHRSG